VVSYESADSSGSGSFFDGATAGNETNTNILDFHDVVGTDGTGEPWE